jgi:hypothetical protein
VARLRCLGIEKWSLDIVDSSLLLLHGNVNSTFCEYDRKSIHFPFEPSRVLRLSAPQHKRRSQRTFSGTVDYTTCFEEGHYSAIGRTVLVSVYNNTRPQRSFDELGKMLHASGEGRSTVGTSQRSRVPEFLCLCLERRCTRVVPGMDPVPTLLRHGRDREWA